MLQVMKDIGGINVPESLAQFAANTSGSDADADAKRTPGGTSGPPTPGRPNP